MPISCLLGEASRARRPFVAEWHICPLEWKGESHFWCLFPELFGRLDVASAFSSPGPTDEESR